ncbi:helix-turn-helix domain-containing protein [Streptococcus parasanguinis]|nr:helix-turn-helix domain-containing protein [Streptococcus parasanguinis]
MHSQVYSWIKKYDSYSDERLIDKRGRHKQHTKDFSYRYISFFYIVY